MYLIIAIALLILIAGISLPFVLMDDKEGINVEISIVSSILWSVSIVMIAVVLTYREPPPIHSKQFDVKYTVERKYVDTTLVLIDTIYTFKFIPKDARKIH